nr:hypothetical protein GCM10020092_043850 [Actinoplanes digitatis]
MSKSKGNLVFVSRLRADGIDPMAVRLGLLADHYRADRDWTDDVLKARPAAPGPLARGGGGASRPVGRGAARRGPRRPARRPRHPGGAGPGRRLVRGGAVRPGRRQPAHRR